MRDLYTKSIMKYESMTTKELQDLAYRQYLDFKSRQDNGFDVLAFEYALHYMAVSVIQDRAQTMDSVERGLRYDN